MSSQTLSSQTTFLFFTSAYTELKAYRWSQREIRIRILNTGLSKKMDGIWNRYNLKSTGRIYTFGILKCSEKFKDLDLP